MQRSYRDLVTEVGALGELDGDLDRRRAGSYQHVDRLALQRSSRRGGEGVAHCFADQVVTEGQPTFVFGEQLGSQKLVNRLEQRRRRRVEHPRHLVEREPSGRARMRHLRRCEPRRTDDPAVLACCR